MHITHRTQLSVLTATAEGQIMYISMEEWEINFSLGYERKLHEERPGAALDLCQEEQAGFQWEEVEEKPSWAEEIV